MLAARALVLLGFVVLLARSAQAVPVPGLFDTGVDAAGAALPVGAADPHYRLVASADPSYPGPNALVSGPIPAGYWIGNTTGSQWISPATDEGYPSGGTPHPAGTYTYRLSFDLAGIDPASVVLGGSGGADNSCIVQLNGVTLATPLPSYNPLTAFTATSGFVAGVNRLDFVVTNLGASGSNPTGVRVQGLSGTGTAAAGVGDRLSAPAFELSAPSPNPGGGRTRIAYAVPQAGRVTLRVQDLAGRAVRTLVDGIVVAGRSDTGWDGIDDAGTRARPGVYFVELVAGDRRAARRLVWMN